MLPFHQTLVLWRRHRGLTQAALAQRARLARPNLSAIERGKREVTLRTVRVLANALGVQPGTLVDGVAPFSASGSPPSLSRATIERFADAVGRGRPVVDPGERQVVAALRTILKHRTAAIQHRRGRPRTSRRATFEAWLALNSRYSPEAIQVLADRVAERQRVHGSPRD